MNTGGIGGLIRVRPTPSSSCSRIRSRATLSDTPNRPQPVHHQMEWRADSCHLHHLERLGKSSATGDIIEQWTYTGSYIPPVGSERASASTSGS